MNVKMKLMRLAAALLCAVLLCGCLCGCSTGAEIDFQYDGVCMKAEEYAAFHRGEKTLEECNTVACQVASSNLEIHNDEISLYLTQTRGKLYQMSSQLGRLLADKTQSDAGNDVTVGFLLDTLGNSANINSVSVVLFQIFNDDAPDDKLLFNKELSGKPHLKLYTVDEDDYLYFYEVELPEQFKDVHCTGLEAVDTYDEWYKNIVNNGSTDVETEG